MGDWGAAVYGDPCRQCGFSWSTEEDEARSLVTSAPTGYAHVLGDADGNERLPTLEWSVAAYVCHVADNLRIWAERLAGIAHGASLVVAAYDEAELATARRYDQIPLPAAKWSLSRSVDDWDAAVDRTPPTGTILIHPERGGQSRAEVVRANAHDTFHHRQDIERILHPGGRARTE